MGVATTEAIHRDTIIVERSLPASVDRAFQAWADPTLRARWSPPSPDEIVVFDAADFRVGGEDLSRCGDRSAPEYAVHARYLDIVANRRIVFTETVSNAGRALSHAVITVEFEATGPGASRVRIIDQIAAIGDRRIIAGNQNGLSAALRNLALHLDQTT